MKIAKGQVTAFIGPSGCGKSTLLRCINRMNDLVDSCRIEGEILLHEQNIYGKGVDVAALRRRVGMVFQRPNPFPKSIYENVVYGLRLQGINDRRRLDEAVERSLRGAALWDEVKDRLHDKRLRPVRRPAAASGDRPGHRHRAGGVAARRADLGPGPHLHPGDRGTDQHPQDPVHRG
jgi:ABC-type Fe3+/spermidine/putrescine transport system ATPase subunit